MTDPRVASAHLPWHVDVTDAVVPAEVDPLAWDRAWFDLAAQEAGEAVNLTEDRRVGHTWLRAPERAPEPGIAAQIADAQDAVRDLADGVLGRRIRCEDGRPFQQVLHIGIGGSALAPQLITSALASPEGLPIETLDNVDPDGIARTLHRLGPRLETTLVLVASKSGGTVETREATRLVRAAIEARGTSFRKHAVAITMPGSSLSREAGDWLAQVPIWDWVGGRFGATSAVGLLPAALAGADTTELLAGAAEMDAWTRRTAWNQQPAALLAASWHAAAQRGHDVVLLPYCDRLGLLGRFAQQLVMESLGKREDRAGQTVERGLTIYGNKGSTDQHAYVQQLRDGRYDALTTFVAVLDDGASDATSTGDLLHGFLAGTRRALRERGRATATILVDRLDARGLGGLIALLERAVGLLASLWDINGYDQPGVEAGKRAATAVLTDLETLHRRLAAGPVHEADLLHGTGDPSEVRHLLLRLAATGRVVRDGAHWRTR